MSLQNSKTLSEKEQSKIKPGECEKKSWRRGAAVRQYFFL